MAAQELLQQQRASPNVQELFKTLLVSCLLMSHLPKQITRPNPGWEGSTLKGMIHWKHYCNNLSRGACSKTAKFRGGGNAAWALHCDYHPGPSPRTPQKQEEELLKDKRHFASDTGTPPNPGTFHILALAAPLVGKSLFLHCRDESGIESVGRGRQHGAPWMVPVGAAAIFSISSGEHSVEVKPTV